VFSKERSQSWSCCSNGEFLIFTFEKSRFCYLAPSAKKGFVDAGFARGFQLKRNQDSLIGEKRNTVKSLRYFSLESIDNVILEDVIREARGLYQ
jgi:hypothetical protein